MFMNHNSQVFIPEVVAQAARRVLAPRSFDESGSEILADFIDETIIKMKSEHRDALLQQLGACAVAVRTLGTMCSGTECPVLVQRAVRLAALRHSVHFQFEHVFSCDKSETVQRFIKTVFAGHVKKLFRDTAEVASPSKRAPDLMTDGEESFVDTVLELIAGFPCTDVSSLRVGAKENREVIKDGAARAGGVFADILQYLGIHQKVESLLLENVKGLGAKKAGQQYSNLDWCVALLESLGYWVFVMLLDPRALGMPVSRNRYWIICIKLSVFTDAGISSEQATALAKELMQDVVSGQPWRNLEDYLLPENHRAVRAVVERSPTKTKTRTKLPAWAEKYAAHLEGPPKDGQKAPQQQRQQQPASGRNWYDPVHPPAGILEAFPHLARLSDQHFTILAARGIDVVSDEGMQNKGNKTIELSQTLGRTRPSNPGECSVVLPGGKIYLEALGRCVVGHEALLLQGLHFGDGHAMIHEFSFEELQNLAGNAFNSYCCAASFLVKETLLGLARFGLRSVPGASSSIPRLECTAAMTETQAAVAAWKKAKKPTLADVLVSPS